MADVHSKEIRSYNMSRIKAKNTKPEMLVGKHLFSNGLRYRLHNKNLPGKPDIVISKYNVVIFVNGCFWHGHTGCKYHVVPKTRTDWWLAKINLNIEKDKQNKLQLMAESWNVIEIWECTLKSQILNTTLEKVLKKIIVNA